MPESTSAQSDKRLIRPSEPAPALSVVAVFFRFTGLRPKMWTDLNGVPDDTALSAWAAADGVISS